MFGKDIVKKMSKAQLAKYKSTKVNNAQPLAKKEAPRAKNPMDNWKAFKNKTRSLV
jgi:hypothetical protein